MDIDGKKVKIQVWDTAGQERFRTITQSYYRSAHGAILAYDLTRRSTFESIPHWIHEIEKYGAANLVVMLIGNKSDSLDKRQVLFEDACTLAEKHGLLAVLETSAKEAQNIEEVFILMAKELIARNTLQLHGENPPNSFSLDSRPVIASPSVEKTHIFQKTATEKLIITSGCQQHEQHLTELEGHHLILVSFKGITILSLLDELPEPIPPLGLQMEHKDFPSTPPLADTLETVSVAAVGEDPKAALARIGFLIHHLHADPAHHVFATLDGKGKLHVLLNIKQQQLQNKYGNVAHLYNLQKLGDKLKQREH
ncbi:hypothetical protein IHE44_0011908 [Lamprotornis superbus]|uniref:Ras-related protein Rab-19 n=1 Tax=Lamprotornis superbus TaxID=245042 RepID=A0A835NVB4_9PASS|nr:hypothetical protein IHE44_0011908 [Lamprotornis superbus]